MSEPATGAKVGVLGLGAMGKPMARQILKAGAPLSVYDVDRAAVDRLAVEGAKPTGSPRELGAASDVVICSLPHPNVLTEAVLGSGGLIEGLSSEGVVIDMGTDGLDTVRKLGDALAEKGISMVDAPVGKGPWAAETGDLTILMAGDREVCRSVEWLFGIVGSKTYYCGPLGAGQAIKLANNLASCANMAIVAEAYALAQKGGADLDVLCEVMPQTSADSWQLRKTLIDKARQGDFSPMFKLKLAHKDMRLIVDMADAMQSRIDCGRAALKWYDAGLAAGFGELDWGAIILTSNPELKGEE